MSGTTKAPHCPRCGSPRQLSKDDAAFWCMGCGFNSGDDALQPWSMAVRAELARQALEMRAHAQACPLDGLDGLDYQLRYNVEAVIDDYNWLGTNPLRLPGEGGL